MYSEVKVAAILSLALFLLSANPVSAEPRLDLEKPGDHLIAAPIKGDIFVHSKSESSTTRLYLTKTAEVGDDVHVLDNSELFICGATVNGDVTTRDTSRALLSNMSLGEARSYSQSRLLVNQVSLKELSCYGSSDATFCSGSIKESIWISEKSSLHILGGSVTGSMRVAGEGRVIIYGKDFNCGFGRIDEKKSKHITGTSTTGQQLDFDLDTAEKGAVYLKPIPEDHEKIGVRIE